MRVHRRYVRKDQDTGGRLGPALQTPLPAQIDGAQQRASAQMPTRCPKCQMPPPTWSVDEYQGHCRCGATWYKTAHDYGGKRG